MPGVVNADGSACLTTDQVIWSFRNSSSQRLAAAKKATTYMWAGTWGNVLEILRTGPAVRGWSMITTRAIRPTRRSVGRWRWHCC
jgi:hypothetical protein